MRRGAVVPVVVLVGCRFGFDPNSTVDASTSHDPITQTLLLDRVAAPGVLIDHPLLVVLDDSRADRSRLGSNAETLRFYDDAGNLLPHELEQVGMPGGPPLVAWVKVPRISGTSTVVTMSYGADPQLASADPVWNAAYEAVWHLAVDAGRDSTGRHPAMAVGTVVVPDGQIGPARHFSRTDEEYLSASASVFAPTTFTLSIWMNAADVPGASVYYSGLSRANQTSSSNEMWIGNLEGDVESECYIAAGQRFGRGGAIAPALWTHLVTTVDSTILRLYQDGVEVDSSTVGGTPLSSGNPILIGADNNGSVPLGQADTDWHNGLLDEARIESVTRSAEFIAYDHAVQRDLVISY